ncbi:hypothetical protein [Rhizobium leguminosarum]|jgi:hypothetical protein|uniref:Uncharacterized protein n=1 Tax=Rhizobium leguminosarum TaxID=384 RepID=A0ABD7PUP9_RHILE|nr:hypothetical protein [Rhizobium leguminosarum]TAV75076.1 hypothetical protein ELI28_16815 [Rhizobium leguminosarum]TAV79676.1 hypothetical protein ELI27_16800 [Rhizobium leguminosarum]TAW31012.1 hypothetical protein ELI19_16570 [Rhizobium leguminosarum]TAW44739.1 hypothetical protein ELI18_16525 [Rhizobium leguminosarum]TAZ31408.1 hypothetical protein ELH73_16780 [Rhizobium leguminosarum]
MIDQAQIRQRLDSCRFLSLESFGPRAGEDSQFDLILEVVELKSQPRQIDSQSADQGPVATLEVHTFEDIRQVVEANADPLVVGPDSAIFTILFEGYAAFQIKNETMSLLEPAEDFSKKLRIYEKSRFLNHVATSTWALEYASDWLGEPLKHFAVICVDHIIDVACSSDPILSMRAVGEVE